MSNIEIKPEMAMGKFFKMEEARIKPRQPEEFAKICENVAINSKHETEHLSEGVANGIMMGAAACAAAIRNMYWGR